MLPPPWLWGSVPCFPGRLEVLGSHFLLSRHFLAVFLLGDNLFRSLAPCPAIIQPAGHQGHFPRPGPQVRWLCGISLELSFLICEMGLKAPTLPTEQVLFPLISQCSGLVERMCVLSPSVMSDSLSPYGVQPARLLCPWDSPGKNTGVGCQALPQGIFLLRDGTRVSYVSCIGRRVLYHYCYLGSPVERIRGTYLSTCSGEPGWVLFK